MAENKEIAISIKDIHKEFILPQNKSNSLKQLAVNMVRRNNKTVQKVLDGVSFDVEKGDFFGIVGRNGSGKSTLLKLIAGVYSPTEGAIGVNGGLTPFIELGVGFNTELSGHDNVYLNGALLGFSRKQMDAMYDEIVEFAELGPYMDQKLKNYSSGMQVRLAFSIAIKSKNDILLFDEVLAVGDEAFQRKCLDVFEQYKAEGQTVVLVTHDMETVRKFCTRAVLINDGKILKIGHPHEVANTYSELNLVEIERDMENKNVKASDSALGLNIIYRNTENTKTSAYKCGDTMKVAIDYEKKIDFQNLVINVYKLSGEHITGFRVPVESGKLEVEIKTYFARGKYYSLVQAIDSEDRAVGGVVLGPEFIITTDRPTDRPGWSGLVPVEYKIVKY